MPAARRPVQEIWSADSSSEIRIHTFGAPEVLAYEDAPKPDLKAGEVLVRVRAVGLNPPDWYLREGYKALPPEWQPQGSFPIIPGTDVSGIVEAVADDVMDTCMPRRRPCRC